MLVNIWRKDERMTFVHEAVVRLHRIEIWYRGQATRCLAFVICSKPKSRPGRRAFCTNVSICNANLLEHGESHAVNRCRVVVKH